MTPTPPRPPIAPRREAREEGPRLESLGVLARGVAHDVNNLLTIILGNSRIALSDLSPDAALRRRLSRILSAAEHATALVDQLFAYSGTAAPAVGPLDLSKLVAAMLDVVRASVSDGCVFEVDLAENLPAVDGDATQVRQVILNLVTNGSQALGDRKGRVSLCTGVMKADASYLTDTFGVAEPVAGEFVYLEVSDTGRGFDASTQQRIFEPLFTTKRSGRGLGLAVVLGIVRSHRGSLKVASGPGEGSSFRVLFPTSQRIPAEPATRRAPGAQ